MSAIITLDYPVKPGDQVALISATPANIEAGSTLLFSVDGKLARLVAKADTPVGWLNIEIEPYDGDFEIPANSGALIFPPELKTIKGLAETFRLAAKEMKQNIDNFKAAAEKASAEIKTILERHRTS